MGKAMKPVLFPNVKDGPFIYLQHLRQLHRRPHHIPCLWSIWLTCVSPIFLAASWMMFFVRRYNGNIGHSPILLLPAWQAGGRPAARYPFVPNDPPVRKYNTHPLFDLWSHVRHLALLVRSVMQVVLMHSALFSTIN